jgi:arginine/lysine/ornithine decarboxylase
LLLASLDAARAQLDESAESIFSGAIGLAVEARNLMDKIPKISVLNIADFSCFPAIDPLRITIGTTQLGLSGFEANDLLSKDFGVVAELVGTESITLIFNLGTQREHVLRLISGLKHLSAASAPNKCTKDHGNISENLAPFKNVSMSLSPRDAFFSRKTRVSIEDSVGQICGELVYPYPPGVPVLMPGEIITEAALKYVLQVRRKGSVIWASDHLLSSLLVCTP